MSILEKKTRKNEKSQRCTGGSSWRLAPSPQTLHMGLHPLVPHWGYAPRSPL